MGESCNSAGRIVKDHRAAVGPNLEIRNRRSSLDGCLGRGEMFALKSLQTPQLNWLIATIESTEDYL